MLRYLFFLAFLITEPLATFASEGFASHTLVWSENGKRAISLSHKKIYSLDILGDTLELTQPTAQGSLDGSATLISLEGDGREEIVVSGADQRFLNEDDEWIATSAIRVGDYLRSELVPLVRVKGIQEVGSIDLWTLTIPPHENFLVSSLGLIAHNFAPAIALTCSIGGPFSWAACSIGIGAASLGGLFLLTGDTGDKRTGETDKAPSTRNSNSGAVKKQRNKPPEPDPKAEGRPHTVIEKPGRDGQYTTHYGDGTYKQYRGSGKDHGPNPRPNIKENELNINPKTGKGYPGSGEVRPVKPEEIPNG